MVPGRKTNGWMGVTEMLFGTCVSGLIFHLFSGQPLLIIGATGPVLLFEVALYEVSTQQASSYLRRPLITGGLNTRVLLCSYKSGIIHELIVN